MMFFDDKEMIKKNSISIKAFTLIEVMVSLILAAMVAFFVYSMMIYSYEGFARISSASKNSNNIRFFISSLRNSCMYAKSIKVESSKLKFVRYDNNEKAEVEEHYYFKSGGQLANNGTYATSLSLSTPYSETRGLLVKETYNKLGEKIQTVLVANNIRTIYYQINTSGSFTKLNLGVIYDEILNAKINDDGSAVQNAQESASFDLKMRLFCFTSRSYYGA